MRWSVCLLLATLLLSGSFPAGATEREAIPGIVVVGWDRLSAIAQAELTQLLYRVPRDRYASLREIHIDGEGYDPQSFDQINCWSAGEVYAVCAHELGHHVDVTAQGWLHDWARALIDEAGCDPDHYIRSTLPRCYFADFPQEFLASMVGEYLLDSAPMWTRALDAAGLGEFRPLNQMVLMTVLSHMTGDWWATVLAYDGGAPVLWVVSPWRCGGPSTISGPGFAVTITTDGYCRVMTVSDRQGL